MDEQPSAVELRPGAELALPPSPHHTPVALRLASDAESARAFARHSRAENTKRAYRTDWADFVAWCEGRSLVALPATTDTVALYVASRAEGRKDELGAWAEPPLKVTTLERRLSAINQAHRAHRLSPPARRSEEPLHSVWAGVVRTKTLAKQKVAPALTDELAHVVAGIDSVPAQLERELAEISGQFLLSSSPAGRSKSNRRRAVLEGLIRRERTAAARDKALLLLGFAAALRRSELAVIDVAHFRFDAQGLLLRIPRSKADQEGEGAVLGILFGKNVQTCPVRAVRSWLRTSGVLEGPVFRGVDRHGNLMSEALTGRTVANIVKVRFQQAGIDPEAYSGHSLRAGFCTQAARVGENERDIMRHSRHKDLKTLRGYIREGGAFHENPTRSLGL